MIKNVIFDMISYFGNDVKRINHALKVHSFAKNIAEIEGMTDNELLVLETAAVLHDIGIKVSEEKYNSSAGKYQEIEGPAIARQILSKYKLQDDFVERVCFLIGHHHTYSGINGLDYQILIEADFIVNIYEDHMDGKQVESICNKYFRTKTGTIYLKGMYNI